jgi:hypothetical protein
MCNAKFSMTMLLMDKKWIYSFGGVNFNNHLNDDSKGIEVERLNTSLNQQWERFDIKSDFLRCCQQGVIPLNQSWANEELGSPGERRYLIFGGVFNYFIE